MRREWDGVVNWRIAAKEWSIENRQAKPPVFLALLSIADRAYA